MTHDINSDPEIWELRELHGDRAALIWLEMLSIADRNSGVVGPASDQTRNQLASKCRTSRVKVGLVLDWCRVKGWTVVDSHIRIAKWRKYNKVRDVDESLSPPTPRPTRHDNPPIPPKGDERFDEFWKEYPKKVGKGAAENSWNKIRPSEALFLAILHALSEQKKSAQWIKDHGKYIPNPATWLNQRRWDDDLSTIQDDEEVDPIWTRNLTIAK